MIFKVPYLVVTNGLEYYSAKVNLETNSFGLLKDISDYQPL